MWTRKVINVSEGETTKDTSGRSAPEAETIEGRLYVSDMRLVLGTIGIVRMVLNLIN